MQVRYKQDTGVIVWTVDVHKAAWAAGLRAGDVLHSIDGQVLESIDHLLERLFEVEVGGVISMEVRGRGSKPEPKPEPRPEPKPKPKPKPKPQPKPKPKPKAKPKPKPKPKRDQVRGHGAPKQSLPAPPRYTYAPWPAQPSRPSGGRYLLRYMERAESNACAAEEESPPA